MGERSEVGWGEAFGRSCLVVSKADVTPSVRDADSFPLKGKRRLYRYIRNTPSQYFMEYSEVHYQCHTGRRGRVGMTLI